MSDVLSPPPVDPALLLARAEAVALHQSGDVRAAALAYEGLLARWPDDAPTLNNYGALCRRAGALEISLACLRRALQADDRAPDSWSNFGNTLAELERYDEAVQAYVACLKLRPDHRDALSNLGVVLDRSGRHAEAISILDCALALDPENAKFHTNRALANLALGNYRAGFDEYEWRWQTPEMRRHAVAGPVWDGAPYPGRRLLVYTEGGFGDVLQFIRFVPLAAAQGGEVVVCVPTALVSLLSRVPGVTAIADTLDALGAVDIVCPIMSLPRALGLDLNAIAPGTPYLEALPGCIAHWRARVGAHASNRLRVGLVWSGGSHLDHDEAAMMNLKRSLTLSDLSPLLALAGVDFHSLQVGAPACQAAGTCVIDHGAGLTSFDETAGLATCMDLIITVDTSVAHLAGALGRPVWVLSRFDQCWRWLSGRTDSPWYASLTLYQQSTPGDWSAPVSAMVRDLGALAADVAMCPEIS